MTSAGGGSKLLPKDMAERLHLEAGDTVLAVETERGILPTPYDPEVEEALAIARKVAGRYRNALRELAKQPVGRRSGEPRWVDRLIVEAVQFDLIREHGGMPGLRDKHALEAALWSDRPALGVLPHEPVPLIDEAGPGSDRRKELAPVRWGHHTDSRQAPTGADRQAVQRQRRRRSGL